MSPTASEVVPNRPLTSLEVRELIMRDFQKMLDNFSQFGSMAAFGRLSYQIKLTFITENAGPQETWYDSRPHPINLIVGEGRRAQSVPAPEQYKNIQQHPLRSAISRAAAITLSRGVTSPNTERLRTGLPVPVDVRQSDGQSRQETVQYAPDDSMPDHVQIHEE